jgi:hypothetical protein
MIFSDITPKQRFHLEAGLSMFSQSIEVISFNIPRRLKAPLSDSFNTLTLGLLLEDLQDQLAFVWANRKAADPSFSDLLAAWMGLADTIRTSLPKFGDTGHIGRALRQGYTRPPIVGFWLAVQVLTKQLALRYTEITGHPISLVDVRQYVRRFYVELDQEHPMCRFVKTLPYEDQRKQTIEATKARIRANRQQID